MSATPGGVPDPLHPANDDALLDRYEARADDAGWTVYDIRCDEPVCIGGIAQVGLYIERADDLVNRLNTLDRQRGGRNPG